MTGTDITEKLGALRNKIRTGRTESLNRFTAVLDKISDIATVMAQPSHEVTAETASNLPHEAMKAADNVKRLMQGRLALTNVQNTTFAYSPNAQISDELSRTT